MKSKYRELEKSSRRDSIHARCESLDFGARRESLQKGPSDEKALKEYAKTLSEKQLDELMIGKDVESIFVSPRDKEPFQIVYGHNLSGGGETVAVIFEKTGHNGLKYASLSMGYSEEYDEETLKGYLPRKK